LTLEKKSDTTDDTNNYALSSIVDIEQTGKSYSDLTGKFPVRSDRGNLYVLVVYLYNDNAILVEPMKNRGDGEQIVLSCGWVFLANSAPFWVIFPHKLLTARLPIWLSLTDPFFVLVRPKVQVYFKLRFHNGPH
jgi:hypothetical protein